MSSLASTVQAASIYGRLTPEGILRFAQNEMNKYNKATGSKITLEPSAAEKLTKMAEDIHQDILAYVRTVSLQQIEGPRGFQYLRDDIQERVDLRSAGRVSKVMFRTFVIE